MRKDQEWSNTTESIRRGLLQAVAYAAGEVDTSSYRIHVPAQIDVSAIRSRLGMTQAEFAACFGFSLDTLRHWEQRTRRPDGAARAYLTVIARAPDAVQAALGAAG